MELAPTLWRTCRVLAGPTRLQLLAQIFRRPDRTVSELAEAVGISHSRASQELRRLQSRGLLKADRRGRWVRYSPVADPRVPSAKPLVRAMQAALASRSPHAEGDCLRIASALTHPRRLRVVQVLLHGPRKFSDLAVATDIPGISLARHLRYLRVRELITNEDKRHRLIADPHPLARCLMVLLKTSRDAVR